MSLQFQSLFESVCRCFGHDAPTSPGVPGTASQLDGSSQSSVKRRTNRLELKDKQWDELFEKKNKTSSPSKPPRSSHPDFDTAQAVAEAKLAANPPKHRSKRKRSAKAREEIFRQKKDAPPAASNNSNSTGAAPMSFSRLINPSLALCFATPIRGTEEEPDETDLRSDNSDTNTLNTCEDTITSTVFFENKLSHIQETRPPMPLFHQFKISQSQNIQNILATDSHSSVKMIQLLQQQKKQQPPPSNDDDPMQLEDSSASESDQDRKRASRRKVVEDAVPDVKAVSSSTDSSRHTAAESSSPN